MFQEAAAGMTYLFDPAWYRLADYMVWFGKFSVL